MEQSPRVIIIGGGITGTASAYQLARAGAAVTVLEKGTLANMGSGRTLAGVRQSGRHPAELPLAMAAVKRWETLGDELGADLEYRQRGNLRLAEDHADAEKLRSLVDEHAAQSLQIEFLDGNQAVRAVSPAISERILAAAYCPSDGHANPIATVHAYANAARRYGARFLELTTVREILIAGGRVAGVVTEQGPIEGDRVIVAAGIDTPRLLAPLGLEFPISLALVPVFQTVGAEPLLDQVLGTARAHFSARQQVDGKFRFSSGGHSLDLSPDDVTVDRMQPTCAMAAETLARAVTIIPELATIPVHAIWGGMVDLTPDGIPVIDRIDGIDGLIVAAGYSGHGFCLGPVSGEIVRDLTLDVPSDFPIHSFQWGRFVAPAGATRPELLG